MNESRSKANRLLVLTFLSIVLIVSMMASVLVLANPKGEMIGKQTSDEYDEISEMLEVLNENETSEAMGFGKVLRLKFHEIFERHGEALEEIKLERRIFKERIGEEREKLISEFKQVMGELHERAERLLEEAKRLRERLRNGTITSDEYDVELSRIRLELRRKAGLMQKLGRKLSDLGREIAEKNREFAQRIIEEQRRFKEELREMVREAIEKWRKKGSP